VVVSPKEKTPPNADHHKPFWFLNAIGVRLGIAEHLDVHLVGIFNVVCRAMTDKDGLAAPLSPN
jgi:hypothetical protein